MSDRSLPTRRSGALPALCLVLLALLSGLADRHSHAGFGADVRPPDRLVFAAGAHPWKAPHVEPTEPGHAASPCPACLHLLRPAAVRPRGLPSLAPPDRTPAAVAASAAVRAGSPLVAADPRAPPSR